LPLYGRWLTSINLFTFCKVLGNHLKYGLPVKEALAAAQKAVSSELFREEIGKVGQELQAGATWADSLRRFSLFPLSLIRAVAAGESRDQLAAALLNMANSYRQEIQHLADRFSRWAGAWVGCLAVLTLILCWAPLLTTILTFVTGAWHG